MSLGNTGLNRVEQLTSQEGSPISDWTWTLQEGAGGVALEDYTLGGIIPAKGPGSDLTRLLLHQANCQTYAGSRMSETQNE